MDKYGEVIYDLCEKTNNQIISYPLIDNFIEIHEEIEEDDDIDFCWRLLKALFSDENIKKDIYKDFQNPYIFNNVRKNSQLLYMFLTRIVSCIESDFLNFMVKRVHSYRNEGIY